jgi:hypothetical protein
MDMHCVECGVRVAQTFKFCPGCGCSLGAGKAALQEIFATPVRQEPFIAPERQDLDLVAVREATIAPRPTIMDVVDISGTYECSAYDDKDKNDWHFVTIRKLDAPNKFQWTNRAGAKWTIIHSDLVFRVQPDCCYYNKGHRTLEVVVEDGRVTSVFGPFNELYCRSFASPSPGSWNMGGEDPFIALAVINTSKPEGTIFGKCFRGGRWRNGGEVGQGVGQGKMLFLRGGRLCFDIGWVGCVEGRTNVADGKVHTVAVQFKNGAYHVLVDGLEEASGLHAVPDHPDTEVEVGIAIGHVTGNGDMAPKFVGSIDRVQYQSQERRRPIEVAMAIAVDGEVSEIPVATIAQFSSLSVNGNQGAVKLQSSNYPNHYWSTESPERVKITNAAQMYNMVPGLSGQGVSFQDPARPPYFLRHCNWKLRSHANDNSQLFSKDATFHVRPALNGRTGYVSYESVNYPGKFICHRSYVLMINESNDSDLHRNDASFLAIEVAAPATAQRVEEDGVWKSVSCGHISCGPGSYYLNDNSITLMFEDITTTTEARRKVDELSTRDPSNPVVMWQLGNPWSQGSRAGKPPCMDKMYLIVHLKKFMIQNLDAESGGTARNFAEAIARYQNGTTWGSPLYFRDEC